MYKEFYNNLPDCIAFKNENDERIIIEMCSSGSMTPRYHVSYTNCKKGAERVYKKLATRCDLTTALTFVPKD